MYEIDGKLERRARRLIKHAYKIGLCDDDLFDYMKTCIVRLVAEMYPERYPEKIRSANQ